jgi:hypothetical protein
MQVMTMGSLNYPKLKEKKTIAITLNKRFQKR